MKQITMYHSLILGTTSYEFLPPEVNESNFMKY